MGIQVNEKELNVLWLLLIFATILVFLGVEEEAIAVFWIFGGIIIGGIIIASIYNRLFRKDEMLGEDDNSLNEENK
tara:strand:+ start:245 stop:472 length:228 start_codon:yes stop_codon:yes gene_type:complete